MSGPRSSCGALLAFALVGSLGCGGAPSPPAVRPAAERDWAEVFCEDVARVSTATVLCVGDQPRGARAKENAAVLRPGPEGYVVEATARGTHWVFSALARRDDLRGYRPWRPAGFTTVRGRDARWLLASRLSGIHAHHLMLTWVEGRRRYVVSAHAADPAIRRAIRTAAERMRAV